MSRMELATSQNVKQIQRLILSPQMQQALHLLQLPIQELSTLVEEELTENPLLELGDTGPEESPLPRLQRGEGPDAFIENTVAYEESLYDLLMHQAKERWSGHELKLAEWIIGSIDERGLLTTPLDEIAEFSECATGELEEVLEGIQTFDPPGVGARSMREALLIQLRVRGKESTLAFRILENYYDDVLHNRIPMIARALSRSTDEIRTIIAKEISALDLRPGGGMATGHIRQMTQTITPDLLIFFEEGLFSIEINRGHLAPLQLNRGYIDMFTDTNLSPEARDYLQEKIATGKWLMRNLDERHQTLYRIGEVIVKLQTDFLSSPKGQLIPLTMKEVAERLHLHESTIARAVSNKYVSCPRGMLSLRSFFTHAYTTESGDHISADTVKELMQKIIAGEEKRHPLSDEVISNKIKERGIPCARRTIAKYRHELGIGNTAQRRIH